jgi:hypothetical protein
MSPPRAVPVRDRGIHAPGMAPGDWRKDMVMPDELKVGMVVVKAAQPDGGAVGVVELVRDGTGSSPQYDVVWVDGRMKPSHALLRSDLVRGAALHVEAGQNPFGTCEVDEVDMTSEVMRVKVAGVRIGHWLDVRLAQLDSMWVHTAAEFLNREAAVKKAKAQMFKPGQVVQNREGGSALARPAVVVQHWADEPAQVQVITSNGLAEVPVEELRLVAESVAEHAASIVRRKDAVLQDFKRDVALKASAAAQEHGWCDEIDGILNDLGLKRMQRKMTAVLHLTVEVEGLLTAESSIPRHLDVVRDAGWWSRTLRADTSSDTEIEIQTDDDLVTDSVEVRVADYRIESVELADSEED